ncbi:tRNA (N(6)-L-threonylcarbamoyladenosine(37)-C(2))-methylthiotransferase MtaB [Sphingosinicella microcystinivorans]|uniref:Threonylcarbamoyladenosine tRNA methylthiotransferase MtaB n=1 Tax=Sphingosinicella microcystinivorans TaxID=335406 RepID=A0AAD1D4Q5_SPHMI|nr:tRNA (N(6)-L-threonylcarbamoyladenosine(37)-C(2))-methylthiotransferase MtaB [Sphingosinicella microcystinivorans]RKS90670.1 threonylcarbamoyladenosine tRNA methylthiotransferase MtaB [Sphingosinicella microcystinivorans]BBE33585.1 tRNA (N(6)-L-threonylcarbamoyladenosine(37)-C(2))-methylthiotran sferase MtaB [Sphingosinicella microcystinivorans]
MSDHQVINLGCRLNIYEGEIIRQHLATAGDADTIVINSCAVTGEAVRQARQTIRRLKRERPEARVIVTGCAAQVDAAGFAAMPEVSRVVGNAEKLDAATLLGGERVRVGDIMAVRETAPHLIDGFAANTRAFVEVQNGCDHRCTFCIIPYARGNSRSVPAGLVIDRIKRLMDAGAQEVVLTGVDLTSYGPDLPGSPTLGSLVQRILTHVPTLRRLRLSSIDSIEADPALVEAITGETRVMPHLHLSLQSGDDMILKRMKRRHTRADAVRFVEAVKTRRPEIAIGADIIAGFPTETDDMFENSLRLIDDCDIVFGHIFPYSARAGTPAARMPQLAVPIRKARAARMREAAARRLAAHLAAQQGHAIDMLVEKDGRTGHAADFTPAALDRSVAPGSIVRACVTGAEASRLLATPA